MTYRTQDADMKAAQLEEALGKIETRLKVVENKKTNPNWAPAIGPIIAIGAILLATASLSIVGCKHSSTSNPIPELEKKSCHDSALRLTGEDAPKFERCEEGATVKVETLGTFIVAICTCSTGSVDAGAR